MSRLSAVKSAENEFSLKYLRSIVRATEDYDENSRVRFFNSEFLPTRQDFEANKLPVKQILISEGMSK